MKRSRWILISFCCLALTLVVGSLLWHMNRTVQQQTASEPSGPERPYADTIEHPAEDPPGTPAASPMTTLISPPVILAIGRAKESGFRSRLNAIGQLGTTLSTDDRQALYDYLRDKSEEKWLRPGQAFALKNDILNILREQEPPPPELTGVLLALRRDESQPLVMRDYALQHLAPWFPKADQGQQEQIIAELRAAAQETAQSYAGTALLSLQRIQEEIPSIQLAPFSTEIISLIDDGSANLLARITAVQLSGEKLIIEAREAVRRIAVDETQATTLRIAAVAALGRLGGDNVKTTISALAATGQDERLKVVAQAALRPQPSPRGY
jgi:hypothetical protein